MAIERVCCSESGDDDNRMASMMGPAQADHQIRQSLQFVWMMLPRERRNVDEVEREFRRLAERALRDMREDAQAFGFGS